MTCASKRAVRAAGALRWALVAACLAAPAARAATLSLWLAPDYGFGASSVSVAEAGGVGWLADASFFAGSPTTLTITTPPSIAGTSRSHATFDDPSAGSSTWTVQAHDRAYQDLWIVIQGHDPTDPHASYYSDNTRIGLVIDPSDSRWRLVHPAGANATTYLAFHVGDLALGASFDLPIAYAVAQRLKVVSQNPTLCVFPQYRVNFLELAVPEPMLLSLLAFAGLGLLLRGRRAAR
jgi:hypothetical protein